mmetsp:Transcript_6136/g.791  ORF Transcript_6136/g.791 Transcript_6136/m.791 type:complete len:91 (-) Transcript_6136:894-1166(-)
MHKLADELGLKDEIPLYTFTRSWSNRTFGKLEPGSMRGSIFTMISTAVGAGCLALPLAFKYVGIILAPLFIFLGLIISYTGVVSISMAAE